MKRSKNSFRRILAILLSVLLMVSNVGVTALAEELTAGQDVPALTEQAPITDEAATATDAPAPAEPESPAEPETPAEGETAPGAEAPLSAAMAPEGQILRGSREDVAYLDASGASRTCASATEMAAESTALGAADTTSWYAVTEDVTVAERITVTGDVHLILCDSAELTAEKGITVNSGNSLTIYAQSTGENAGKLTAGSKADDSGNGYAAIGSEYKKNNGLITINGGLITATGGAGSSSGGAGIGGGGSDSSAAVTINGGTVTATGGASYNGGAGIGGNYYRNGYVIINGGVIEAVGNSGAAGIGGGWNNTGYVTINGGTVTATGGGGDTGAGIGGARNASGFVTINGGTVTATASGGSAGIGGGLNGDGTVTITGGTVTGTATGTGAGIGGAGYRTGTVTITGGTVTGNGGTDAAGIGGGSGSWGLGIVTISGGHVTATAKGTNGVGIGSSKAYTGSTADSVTLSWTAESQGSTFITSPSYYAKSGAIHINSNFVLQGTNTIVTTENIAGATIVPYTGEAAIHTVTFKDGETTLFTRSVVDGETVTPPTDPKKEFCTFYHWRLGNAEYDFTAPVTGDLTLTAYFRQNPSVEYLDASGAQATQANYDYLPEEGDLINHTIGVESAEKWYVLNRDVTYNERITMAGNVHIILCDGYTLTADRGITVQSSNSLTIYAQSAGEHAGVLTATAKDSDNAGIGGTGNHGNSGAITINGGVITASGDRFASGIGGSYMGTCGNVTINGGKVTATGEYGAGIGFGDNGSDRRGTVGTITITGGEVNAYGKLGGIGDGHAASGSIVITGGTVNASCLTDSPNYVAIRAASVTLGWTEASKNSTAITAATYAGDLTLSSDFCLKDVVPATLATADNIAGATIVPYTGTVHSAALQNEDGSAWKTVRVIHGQALNAGEPEKSGWEFAGWVTAEGSVPFAIDTPVTDDLTLRATFTTIPAVRYLKADGTEGSQATYVKLKSVNSAIGTADTESWYAVAQNADIAQRMTVSGDVHLILCDGATLTAVKGITVEEGNSLTVHAGKIGNGAIAGTGALTVTSPDAGDAGIGSRKNHLSGAITVSGGVITAQGGDDSEYGGAGIGSGGNSNYVSTGAITVSGGTISATGGNASGGSYRRGGAGIGGGGSVKAEDITISGGTITATGGEGQYAGAGIGGGGFNNGGKSADEPITLGAGATVTATGGAGNRAGAGIGGGGRSYGYVEINGATVLAATGGTGDNAGAGIGSGGAGQSDAAYSDPSTVTIRSGAVTATGGAGSYGGAGIGSGSASRSDVTISGGTVSATGGTGSYGGAGVGGSGGSSSEANFLNSVTISGGTVNATGGRGSNCGGAGIGLAGNNRGRCSIAISGGAITAAGDLSDRTGPGIGGDSDKTKVSLTLSWTEENKNSASITASSYLVSSFTYPDTKCYILSGSDPAALALAENAGAQTIVPCTYPIRTVRFYAADGQTLLDTVLVISGQKVTAPGAPVVDEKVFSTWLNAGTPFDTATEVVTGDLDLVASYVDHPTIAYLDADGTTKTCDAYGQITGATTAIGTAGETAWYIVSTTVTAAKNIAVSGDVRLILLDDTRLTAENGIRVSSGNSLTIYAGALQSAGAVKGNGQLIATGKEYPNRTGIGCYDGASGVITINGGVITATGSSGGAGIGGSYNKPGTVIINGGTVTATALNYATAAGIGGGNSSGGDSITINGGTVVATGGSNAPGIGGGSSTTIKLGWTKMTDSITASSYNGKITLTKDFALKSTYGPADANGVKNSKNDTLLPAETFYTVTFQDAEGGTFAAKQIVKNGYASAPELTPRKADHLFRAWQLGGSDYDFAATPVTGDVALTPDYQALGPVRYLDARGAVQTVAAGNYHDAGSTEWNGGWLAVTEDMAAAERIVVSGAVNLILCDGAALTASQGITVGEGSSLTIYAGTLSGGAIAGSGKLTAKNSNYKDAVIGGSDGNSAGAITIYGGDVTATCGNDGYGGAGIGGGNSAGATVTIYGGSVTTNGTIGNGNSSTAPTAVAIYGGHVSANIIGNSNGASGAVVTFGWTEASKNDTEITAGKVDGSVTFARTYVLEGGTTVAAGDNISGETIVPYAGSLVTVTFKDGDAVFATRRTVPGNPVSDPGAPMRSGSVFRAWKLGEADFDLANTNVAENITLTADFTAAEAVAYLGENGASATVSDYFTLDKSAGSLTLGTAGQTTWYAVKGTLTVSERITARGTVNLILCDGFRFTASKGITVSEGNSLNIFAQSTGSSMGVLQTEKYNTPVGMAGIGGGSTESDRNSGAITIYGGKLNAIGGGTSSTGLDGAGIGGGNGGTGNVTIRGGDVYATYTPKGAGIGGGNGGAGIVVISGGTVEVDMAGNSSQGSAGIGGGNGGNCDVTITGGNVIGNVAIGAGKNGGSGTVRLKWTKATDSIYASDYRGTVVFDETKPFLLQGTETVACWTNANNNIKGKTLIPASTYTVSITAGEGMSVTSGELTQKVVIGEAMADVVFTAADTYYFPADYAVEPVHGVTVKRDSAGRITVSGTPTTSAAITLAAATPKTQEAVPEATFTATGYSTGTLANVSAGMQYRIGTGAWQEITGSAAIALTDLDVCTITLRRQGTESTMASSEQTITLTRAATPTLTATPPQEADGKGSIDTTQDHEYSADGGQTWIACTGVTQLAPGAYSVRVAAKGTALASEAQALTIQNRKPTPTASFVATGEDSGTLSGVTTGMKYSTNGGTVWSSISSDTVVIPFGIHLEKGILVKTPGEGELLDSAVQHIELTQPKMPNVTVTQPGTIGGKGSVTVTSAMEYRAEGETSYTPCTDGTLTLAAGTYFLRYQAAGTALASADNKIVIKACTGATVTFKVVNGCWNDGTDADKTVVLSGLAGDTLKLTAAQIPAVGGKPSGGYETGAWDVTPGTNTAITEDTTYTYTYAAKPFALRLHLIGVAPDDVTVTLLQNGAKVDVQHSISGNTVLFPRVPGGSYVLQVTDKNKRYVPFSNDITLTKDTDVKVPLVAEGDLNGVGAAGADDMQALFEYLSTGTTDSAVFAENEAYFLTVADFNGDKAVNILDYQALYLTVQKNH